MKTLAHEQPVLSGEAVESDNLKIGYFAQHQLEQLDKQASALLHLQRIDPRASEKQLRAFLGGFNFQGDRVLEPVAPFSGGEKARLVLALLIWQKPNLLLLDEPTNHLDLEMRLALNHALQSYAGSVILVSHDRHLLRTVCDELLLVDRGRVEAFDDEIDAYPRWLAERRSDKPGRLQSEKGSAVDKKEKKRQQAEFRKSIQPQLQRQQRLEREMEKIRQQQDQTEALLGDEGLYQSDRKDQLRDVLFSQAENNKRIEQLETEWFEISEEIEQLHAEFEQSS